MNRRDSTDSDREPLLGTSGRENEGRIARSLPRSSTMARWFPCVLITAIIAFLLFVLIVVLRLGSHPSGYSIVHPGLSSKLFKDGLDRCERLRTQTLPGWHRDRHGHLHPHRDPRPYNPRRLIGQAPVLLRGGLVWDPEDGPRRVDVLLEHGLIKNVSCCIHAPNGTRIFNVGGRVITPGLVDMHSHAGLDSWPGLSAEDDTNEWSAPLTPQLRSLDAFNPADPALRAIASGGVTTALVMPGSANLMGGEGYVFKFRPAPTVAEMLVNYNDTNGWRWMKMACGENPKRVYGPNAPATRMGEAYLFRAKLRKALELVRSQDSWCESASSIQPDDPATRILSAFPDDLSISSLVDLIRGRVRLNVHCYEPQDIEMVLRIMGEFGVQVTSFHHALGAYKIPDLLHHANVTVATFADLWGYKKEAYDASVHAPRILLDHGVPVALKSDHPVINSQFLMFEAAKAYHYGLKPQEALAAVTTVPARALGLDYRIGRVAAGMDGDVVVWDIHPLRLGARPIQVFIDGQPQIDTDDDLSTDPKALADPLDDAPGVDLSELEPVQSSSARRMDHGSSATSCHPSGHTYNVRNIGRLIAGPDRFWQGGKDPDKEVMIIVRDGIVRCLGYDCKPALEADTYYMNGGTVIPGMISAGVPLGLFEIEQESSTSEGHVPGTASSWEKASNLLRAEDGIAFGGKHLQAAYHAGVTTAISPPVLGRGVMAGLSAAFRTSADNAMQPNAFVQPVLALHVQIGEAGKHASTPTISAQIAFLRGILLGNLSNEPKENLYAAVARGESPLIVHTHAQDHIAAVIRLRQEIRFAQTKAGIKGEGMRVVIVGGAEAHLLASELAAEKVPVVLQPARCQPSAWEMRRCLPGAPLSKHSTAQTLAKAGVKVALSSEDIGQVRNLLWEAGWTVHGSHHHIHESDAIGMVTWQVASIFGIDESAGQIRVGDKAEFVGFDGRPFDLSSRIMLVAGGMRSGVKCYPEQD